MKWFVGCLIVALGCAISPRTHPPPETYPIATTFNPAAEARKLQWEMRRTDVERFRLQFALKIAEG